MTTARAVTGIFAGAFGWALNQQANYSFVPVFCKKQFDAVPIVALVAILIIAAGAFVSWRAEAAIAADAPQLHAQRFLARLGILVAALFAFAVLMQGTASFVLDPCQH